MIEIRQKTLEKISNISSKDSIFDLFKTLGYSKYVGDIKNSRLPPGIFEFNKEASQSIKNIYRVLEIDDKLAIFLVEIRRFSRPIMRHITKKIWETRLGHEIIVIFTVDYSVVKFVRPLNKETKRGIKLSITEIEIDKEDMIERKEYYTVVVQISNLFLSQDKSIWEMVDEAFNVRKVTEKFFACYKDIFFELREYVIKKFGIQQKDAHYFALHTLNRIMFLYFLSKKGWLGKKRFVNWLWNEYKKDNKYGGFGKNKFYRIWLSQIFFKALNNKSHELENMPDHVIKIIRKFPYLNGGLFREDRVDKMNINIDDELMEKIIQFFERYNFTIREDIPLEEEVAVDPKMIGYVYESLATVAEEIYERKDFGIFYTPVEEVDFMCRLSLGKWLVGKSKHEQVKISGEDIYKFIFSDHDERKRIFQRKKSIVSTISALLDSVKIVDPACGSGAFLVGMLNVLSDLKRTASEILGEEYRDYETKRSIIQRSIYGVDVMEWAIMAAELRLWLQLIVETREIKDVHSGPLLPNLNANLRVGDSLVQDVGGYMINMRSKKLEGILKSELENLREEKMKYFDDAMSGKYKSIDEIKKKELEVFLKILDERVETLEAEIDATERELKKMTQEDLFGRRIIPEGREEKKKYTRNINYLKRCKNELEIIKEIKKLLEQRPEKRPFIWEIDFIEVFGLKGGFDIVIGNPPYIRQEQIRPPNTLADEVTNEDKKAYKEKLIESVKNIFGEVINDIKISKRSDYYIYFFFHGLGLLNENGFLCFITSNSWLDVEFGSSLQEFLLKYVKTVEIFDSPVRSFEHADINTIISLFSKPTTNNKRTFDDLEKKGDDRKIWPAIDEIAKFVKFKEPYGKISDPETMLKIEKAGVKVSNAELVDLVENVINDDKFRLFPITHRDLLQDGWEYPEGEEPESPENWFSAGKYAGNKWGGKFLRAPDIFFTILKKGKDKLVKLGKIAKIRFGIKTGANDFFYLPSKYFDIRKEGKYYRLIPKQEGLPTNLKIEEEFLRPVVKSPRELKTIVIKESDLKHKVFICNKNKRELKGTGALEYIKWGEKQRFQKNPTISSRKRWYTLPKLPNADILFNQFFNERFLFPWNRSHFLVDHAYYYVLYPNETEKLVLILNSVITFFMVEIYGRTGLGQGALQTYAPEMKPLIILNPSKLKTDNKKISKVLIKYGKYKPISIFTELGFNLLKPIHKQEPRPLPDRAALDKIIFDELGLSEEERKEVYRAVAKLVKERLDKAKSKGGKDIDVRCE